jgi:hypothetical protein
MIKVQCHHGGFFWKAAGGLGTIGVDRLSIGVGGRASNHFQEPIHMEQWISFLGRRPYEGWIQCLLALLLWSLQKAPRVGTMQGSSGRSRYSTVLRLIWDHEITVTRSSVVSRGEGTAIDFQASGIEILVERFSEELIDIFLYMIILPSSSTLEAFCVSTLGDRVSRRGCFTLSRLVWDPGIILSLGLIQPIVVGIWRYCLRTSNLWEGKTIMSPFLDSLFCSQR